MRSQNFWNFWKKRNFRKNRKFSKTWFFDFQRNFNNFRKIMFSKIFDFPKIFEISENFQKFSRLKLWRILIFDLLNGSFWSFFMDRSGFSRRIELVYQKLHQNQLGKGILQNPPGVRFHIPFLALNKCTFYILVR